jgi:flagellin
VGKYIVNIQQDARKAVIVGKDTTDTGGTDPNVIPDGKQGTININGESIKVEAGENVTQVFERLRDTCSKVNVDLYATDGSHDNVKYPDMAGYISEQYATGKNLVFMSKEYGSSEQINIKCDNPDLASIFGLTIKGATAKGFDAKATVTPKSADPTVDTGSLFNNTATVSVKGNEITVTDKNDFKMVLEAKPGTLGSTFTDTIILDEDPGDDLTPAALVSAGTEAHINVSVLDAGPMDLQIGANEGQTMAVRIPKVTPVTLGIDNINIGTADGAQEAIGLLDKAVNTVSAIRSKLGAYQNRLEHSISNLDETSENLTESLSRIEDVDMAEEMANYTQKNVLAQAGTSMLAQANQRPQTVLTLLQQ